MGQQETNYSYKLRKCLGRVPFGYSRHPTDKKVLVPVEKELDILLQGIQYLRGGYTYRSVAAWISKQTGRHLGFTGLAHIYKRYLWLNEHRNTRTTEEQKASLEKATAWKEGFIESVQGAEGEGRGRD